ncbi:MAG TPA: tetratricopeptide repeat protein [Chitinophagaceae bacterium]|nr:tetratricopeptide repeat protein [Chitinophagaceae bacterium]
MQKLSFVLICLVWAVVGLAQDQDVKKLHETARTFQQQGDYANAVLVLNRAMQLEPNNLELRKDLAFTYYLQRDFVKAREAAKPLPERPDADVQSYQILGMVYKAIEERKECEKLYKAGLKKFPNSGVLYNEYGEMLWTKQDYTAIKFWEKGIEVDPNFSGNYYNAAKHYYFTYDKVWSLIYGEIFLNLESYSKRTAEIKDLLLEGYKKLFSEANMLSKQETKNPFAAAFLGTMAKSASQTQAGITPESLTIVRTRFVLDWFDKEADKFPFRLFEYQRQLLKEGMFDAYNQWIFGAAQNLPAFQNWTTTHAASYNQFTGFQKGRVFKLPTKQYYQTVASK